MSARDPIPIGTMTKHGKVQGYHWDGHERYYFLTKGENQVAYLPASVVEATE